MKVCLINFPFTNDRFIGREYGRFEQYEQNCELACIASYLELNDVKIDIIECTPMNYNVQRLADYVKSNSFDALVLAAEEYTFLNIVRFLNKIGKGICLIFSGAYSVINYKKILKSYPENSFCLLANKEEACLKIIQNIQKKEDICLLKDIAYYDGDVKKNEISEGIDFSKLPLPKRIYISQSGMAGIESTRGCNNNCIYCAVNARRTHEKKHNIQYKNTGALIEEMTDLIENREVKFIRFHDENFLISSEINRKRLNDLCDAVEEKNWNIKFKIFARATDLIKSQDILVRLKKIGLDSVFVGIESFVQRQLDFYRKNTTVQQNKEALRILKECDIRFTIGFLPLDPYVSLEELVINFKTLKEIEYSKVDLYSNLPISCIPPLSVLDGSDFQKIIEQEGLGAANDVGYKFVEQKIQKFYQLKQQWCDKIISVHDLNYLIGMAERKNHSVLLAQLKREKVNLMELDLDVLLDILEKLRLFDNSEVVIDNKFLIELQRIKQVFVGARTKLMTEYSCGKR